VAQVFNLCTREGRTLPAFSSRRHTGYSSFISIFCDKNIFLSAKDSYNIREYLIFMSGIYPAKSR